MYSFINPLEQFEVVPLFNLSIGSFDLSFTNASFIIILGVIFFVILVKCVSIVGNGYLVPNAWQSVLESFYKFVLDVVYENLGAVKGREFYPFFFSLFVFLILCNVLGLVPYSYTVTSHFVVTFILSLLVWVSKLFVGFRLHGIKLFGILLPSGIPFAMVPFFVIVELISFFIPLAALGIRLFANIMAGHILLKVLIGFCWSIILASGLFFILHFVPLVVVFLLLFLETAVAFIQAYVFTMLACLYIGDIVRGGH